ncbi:aminopeptidase N [Demequina muriae]|uniref:Aminopeptidase N n=1 Tax=Demequina muriae TaxID=3051664 RepID=A0ABT8GEE6_9MICO|nr:aminopeptidase N [Demequina sp. EGI L300058]MDN4479801.1 aminopeptidase N [Demequina sp. EGI L300058]
MLTREEAIARARSVGSAAYDVHLDFTPPGDTFRSLTTVTFEAEPGTTTFLDLVGAVRRLEVNGRVANAAEAHHDGRVALVDLDGATTVTVEADCDYRTDGQGIHRFVDPEDGSVYLYSQFAADDARRAFACFDQPDIKGTFAFTVTAPSAWTVVSNSPTPEPDAVEGEEANRWTFAPTVPLPCYVAAVVAGPYASAGGTLTSTKGEIPARVYGRANLADHLDADEMIATVQAGLTLFEDVFGVPYPYEKYDQIFVPEYNLGAMENAGCVTFSEDRLVFRSRASDAMREFRTNVTLHELSHQWFGNLVTMRWWDDLWLNESFAEFMGAWATSKVTPWTDSWVTFTAERKSIAYVQDQLPTTHPIVAQVLDTEATVSAFDMITYAKGASALKQLVAFVGEDRFFAGVHAYLTRYSHGNATLADFLDELEEITGHNLDAWAGAWLETPGPSTLRPVIEERDGLVTALWIAQDVPAAYPMYRPHQVRVAGYVHDAAASRFDEAWSADVTVDGSLTEVLSAAGEVRPDLLLVNDRDLTYAKIVLDDASIATVTAHIADLRDPMALGLVLDALWHMVRDAQLPAATYIDAVLTALPGITNSETTQSHLRTVVTALSRYVPPAAAAAQTADAAGRLWDVLTDAPAGSDLQLQSLKGFARLASTSEHAARLAALADGDEHLTGLDIDTDLRWELLAGLAACGEDVDKRSAAALADDPGAIGRRRAAGVKAAHATPEAKREAWEMLVRPDAPVANAVQYEVALGLVRAADPDLLLSLVPTILDELTEYYAQNEGFVGKRVAAYVFPAFAAGRIEGLDTTLDEWLATHADAPSVLRKVVTEGTDEVRRALRAQETAAE